MKSKTAGKRTSRPGRRADDLQGKRTAGRRKGAETAGKTIARTTNRNIVAHQRAAGRRRQEPASK